MTEAIFKCPTCEATYKVVRIEAPPSHFKQLLCLGCGGPLRSRDGKYALTYFRIRDTRRVARFRKLKLVYARVSGAKERARRGTGRPAPGESKEE